MCPLPGCQHVYVCWVQVCCSSIMCCVAADLLQAPDNWLGLHCHHSDIPNEAPSSFVHADLTMIDKHPGHAGCHIGIGFTLYA